MALEELIRQHERQTDQKDTGEVVAAHDKGSLIQQAKSFAEPERTAEEIRRRRGSESNSRSPIQYYHTADDYYKRRRQKVISIALTVCAVVLLAVVLVRTGLLRF